jgi:FkbM family methyltransferase
MNNAELQKYIVHSTASFVIVYYRFNLTNARNILLVCNNNKLVGLIGVKDMVAALSNSNKETLTANDIMNSTFSYILESDNIHEKCLELFYENNFNNIPIINEKGTPIDLVSRCDMFELRMITYTEFGEDIVLNFVLRDVDQVFYIDVGAFDPWLDSVTKWLYDSGKGRGINIEPQPKYYHFLCNDRLNDINLMVACGKQDGEIILHVDGGLTTGIGEYATSNSWTLSSVVTTLNSICEKHLVHKQEIHLLKIDVEGFEEDVLIGADFKKYRPWIVLIEATKPMTNIPTYAAWEQILIRNNYDYVMQYGVNRLYLAKEKKHLKERFMTVEQISKRFIVTKLL